MRRGNKDSTKQDWALAAGSARRVETYIVFSAASVLHSGGRLPVITLP